MYGSMSVGSRSLEEYRPVVGNEVVDELRALAAPLRGTRVLHLTSPVAGGAVRGILERTVPLLIDLGLSVKWEQFRMPVELQDVDRDLHRALSGEPVEWDLQKTAALSELNHINARLYDQEHDVVVVHHTASIGLHEAITQLQGRPPGGVWVWHSHRDYRTAVPEAWALVRQHAVHFAAAVFDYREFMRDDVPNRVKAVIPPCMDPTGARTQPVDPAVHAALLSQRGIDLEKPILSQISFMYREGDPLRALDAYEVVKRFRPDVQLVMVNMTGVDTPQQQQVLKEVHARGAKLGGILMLTDLDRVGNVEIAALREKSTVMLHEGLPRGISMELLEEMWQAKPIISGSSPVALATLKHERTGLLADSPMDQANHVVRLLEDPRLARRLGERAHAEVARRYLVTHHLKGYLRLLRRLVARRAS